MERFWRTSKECFIYGLDIAGIHSLEEFNRLFKEFLRTYNLTEHSGIGCRPFDRYQATRSRMKIPESREWLDEHFLNRVTRRVRKDATITIDRMSYDVPMQFIGQTVEIRFRPGEPDSAVLFYEDERHPLRQTDRNENCRTKRNNPVIDYSRIGGSHV